MIRMCITTLKTQFLLTLTLIQILIIKLRLVFKMLTIRQYIQNHKHEKRERNYQRSKADSYASRSSQISYTQHLPSTFDKCKNIKYDEIKGRSSTINSQSVFMGKKLALPPIRQFISREKLEPIDTKRTEVLSRYFKSKKIEINSQRRLSTDIDRKVRKKPKSQRLITFEQQRMRPLDKYFYQVENIRLAERLLIVKPSPQLCRTKQKKFYLQQKNYKQHISHSYSRMKSKRTSRNKTEMNKRQSP